MNLVMITGYISLACLLPLVVKQGKGNHRMLRLLRANHYVFGWLMMFLIIPHMLFSFSSITHYPFGLLSFLMLVFLNSFIFMKKNKHSVQLHKAVSVGLLVSLLLHIVME